MARQKCKSSKCRRTARWALTATDDNTLPEFVCRHHWNELRTAAPIKALSYGPIALRPGGILNRTAVVRQRGANPLREEIQSVE